jgi:formylglycine-generating enzyme required for sulfatase activity
MVGLAGLVAILLAGGAAQADTFGMGANQFTIDFVTISGDSGNLGSWPAGDDYTFTGVNRNDYRIGRFEITNDQWNKFKASLGVPVTGTPSLAYDHEPYWTGTNVPINGVSWYEAAQFVNWLNTSTGHQAAYKFTGAQGQSDYALATWSAAEADNGTNLYRHKDAEYYLPTENEWVKAGVLERHEPPDPCHQSWRQRDARERHERDGVELLRQRVRNES